MRLCLQSLITHPPAKFIWDNVLRGKIGLVWNSQGKVSEVFIIWPKSGKGTITYDEKGNVAEATFFPADGSAVKKEKYAYEFDERGNWTKKTLHHWVTEEGKSFYKLVNITHRTISYY